MIEVIKLFVLLIEVEVEVTVAQKDVVHILEVDHVIAAADLGLVIVAQDLGRATGDHTDQGHTAEIDVGTEVGDPDVQGQGVSIG